MDTKRFNHYYLVDVMQRVKEWCISGDESFDPDNLLKDEGNPDLCPSCAQGKPTIRRSHQRRQRATRKGSLWFFFDVSGGGKRVPSLIDGNIYLHLFVDSYSRKYFPYYSKSKDEKDTIRMKQHF